MSHFLNSPALTGIPTAPTAAPATNTTQLATCAFVLANGGTGTVTSIGVTTANGVSGTSSGGATPSLTITLGAITPTSVNGFTFTALAIGGSLAAGTTSKTFTFTNTLTLSGTDGSTLNIGAGGTLGTAAYTAASDYEAVANKSTSTSLGTSNTLYPTQNAVKVYVDTAVTGLLDDRGNFDASGNAWPTTGGSGTAGAILKGDLWYISVAGTLGGVAVHVGDSIRALVDTPGSTAANWDILSVGLGFVPATQSQTFYLGTTSIAINRGSGAIVLTGITSIDGSAASFTGSLVGDVTGTQGATAIAAATVNGKALTGFSLGTDGSALAATDTILQGFQKLQVQQNVDLIAVQTKTTTYNPTVITDKVILCDATGGAFAITLLAAPTTGQNMTFKKIDSSANAVTINGNGKNIDGAASTTLPAQWNAITIVYDGTAWYII